MNQKVEQTDHYGENTEKKIIKESFQRTLPNLVGFRGELFPAFMEQIIPKLESVPKAGKRFNLLYKINLSSISKLTKIVQNSGTYVTYGYR